MMVTQFSLIIASQIAMIFIEGSYGNEFCKCFAWDLINLTNVDVDYDPTRVIATGMSVSTDDKVFITTPRPTKDVPCTLMSFDLTSGYCSSSKCVTIKPSFTCWPSYELNTLGSCDNVINAHAGMRIDKWGRAWVVDSGLVGSDDDPEQVCPPRIHLFDLKSGKKLLTYELPTADDCFPPTRFVNIVVDSGDSSENTVLIIADMVGLIVYSYASNSSWRFRHPYFSYDPVEGDFKYGSIRYQEAYSGISGLALSPANADGNKTLYFHSLASNSEFSVSTSVLRDSGKVTDNYYDFKKLGERGHLGRSLGQVVSRKSGTLIFSLMDWNGTACWNPACPYGPATLQTLNQGDNFACDMVVDNNDVVHVLYNDLPSYMDGNLPQAGEDSFYIHCGRLGELVKDTVCDPDRNCA